MKEYTDESLVDLQEDVWDAINVKDETNIPVDENGFRIGRFEVVIKWFSE